MQVQHQIKENMELVLSSGNHYLGTVRSNKRGLPPKEFHFQKTGRNKKQRGDMMQMKKTLPSGKDVHFIAWHDNKPVHMLSSIPAYKTSCIRAVRNANGTWDPNTIIPRPSCVDTYNVAMGGTDSEDQRIAYYRPNVKATASWYPRCFIHTIVICCCNAYIIYYLYWNLDRKVYTYLDFLRELIDELAQEELSKSRNTSSEEVERPNQRQHKTTWNNVESRLRGMHIPQTIKDTKSATRNLKQSKCLLCHRFVTICCKQCKVFLCVSENEKSEAFGMPCWEAFHTLPKITQD